MAPMRGGPEDAVEAAPTDGELEANSGGGATTGSAAAAVAGSAAAAAGSAAAAAVGSAADASSVDGASVASTSRSEGSEAPRGRRGSITSLRSLGSGFLIGTPDKWIGPEAQNRRLERGSVVLQRLRVLQESHKAKGKEAPWIKTTQADLFFGFLILAYAILTGVDVQIQVVPYHVSAGLAVFLEVLQALFVLAFVVELGLRVRVDSWRYCLTKIGAFDSIIVFLGALEVIFKAAGIDSAVAAAIPMRLFRLLRLVRIVRAISVCRELKLLFMGLVGSLSAVFWSMVLLMMLIYLGTLLCVILLGTVPELHQYFGSVGYGLFTHFMLVTLEAWPDISDDTMEATGEPMWAVYFIVFVCLSSFALMNLVTGVICEKLLIAASTSEENKDIDNPTEKMECYQKACEEAREGLHPIFVQNDMDANSVLDCEEFCAMKALDTTKALFKQMDITTDLEGHQMFEIIDESKKGTLSFDEIIEGLLRLRGSRMQPHSIMLQRDIVRCKQRELKCLADLQSEVDSQIESDLKRVHVTISRETDEVLRLLEAAVAPPAQEPAAAGWGEEVERLEALIGKLDGMHASAKALVADGAAAPAHVVPAVSFGTQTEWDESHQDQVTATVPAVTYDVTTGACRDVYVTPAPVSVVTHAVTQTPMLGTHHATEPLATTVAPSAEPVQAPAPVTTVGPTTVESQVHAPTPAAPPAQPARALASGGAAPPLGRAAPPLGDAEEAPPSSAVEAPTGSRPAAPPPNGDGATANSPGSAVADDRGSEAAAEARQGVQPELGEPAEDQAAAPALAPEPTAPRSESGDAASSQGGALPLPPSNAASSAGASAADATAAEGGQGGVLPGDFGGARGAEKGDAADAEDDDGTWVCPACTLENSSLLPACEACENPRPMPRGA